MTDAVARLAVELLAAHDHAGLIELPTARGGGLRLDQAYAVAQRLAGMSLPELQACLAWVAHGFEVVHTHFADWRFTLADTVADFALHGRLFVGPRQPVDRWPELAVDLAAMRIELLCDGVTKDRGLGSVVLDGPLHELQQWIDAMAVTTPAWRVGAGEFVTTGTLTDAGALRPGQHWQTRLSQSRLVPLSLRAID